ncbi:Helicase associated domain protein [Streptomyces sp. NPDC012421]|uniref:DEAD/DEAH box helicase n=1 Tax=Streptomyces sp. NPDC012421 TaxID=3364832 RepID=UPI0036F160C9
MELRPYQHEAITAIVHQLAAGGTGQLHAACGSGKSLIGQQAALRLLPAGGTAAVLVPSLALVAQTITTWRALHPKGAGLDVLAVCSDDTVTDAPAHLPDIPARTTTDPGTIADWLARPSTGDFRLILSTYASASRLHEALQRTGSVLDLRILDEAHHLAGRPEYVTRQVTRPGYLPAARTLYMTATPRTNTADAERHGFLSMDDTDIFGPVLYSYPFSRGIAEGYLEDYRLYVVGLRESEARALLADKTREYVDGPGAPSLQTLVAQAALVRAAEQFGVRRAVSFHHRVEQAAEFARTLPATTRRLAPRLPAPVSVPIHGDMAPDVRASVLGHLRTPPAGGWTVVANARLLGEGVDVPALDTILFAHPKSSAVDIVQAVGRALRRHPDPPGPSTVIVPLIVPEQDGDIGDLEPGDYATLWQVVRALRAHDEPLGFALDHQRSHRSVSNPQLPSKITIELPRGTSQDILTQVQLMLVRQTTSPWWDGFAAATDFHAEHGHLDIPLRHKTADGIRVGQWLVKARQFRRRGWLPADRIEALERLGVVWDPAEARWRQGYQRAADWHARHGHLDVAVSDDKTLAHWLVHQRQYRRAGKLAETRIELLDRIGMIWEHRDNAFQRNLDALAAFKAAHGHTLVPQRHTQDGVRLGSFVSQMRAKYTAGKLPRFKVLALEEAGMVWRVDLYPRQARQLAAAASFHHTYGHLRVPATAHHDGVRLGEWLARQRKAHKAGDLDQAVGQALDAIDPGWTGPPDRLPSTPSPQIQAQRAARADAAWEKGLAAATAFHREHGHLRVPDRHVRDGVRLDAWLYRQRKARKEGTLPAQRVETLDALGITWTRGQPLPAPPA